MTNTFEKAAILDKIDYLFFEEKSNFTSSEDFGKYMVLVLRESFELDDIVSVEIDSDSEYDDQGGSYTSYRMIEVKFRNGFSFDSSYDYVLPEGMTEDDILSYLKAQGSFDEFEELDSLIPYLYEGIYDLYCCDLSFYGYEFDNETFVYEGETPKSPSLLEKKKLFIDHLIKTVKKEAETLVKGRSLSSQFLSILKSKFGDVSTDGLTGLKLKKNEFGKFELKDILFTDKLLESENTLTFDIAKEAVSELEMLGMEEYLEDSIVLSFD